MLRDTLTIIGRFGGTHLGEAFAHAAAKLNLVTLTIDVEPAYSPSLTQKVLGKFGNRRPMYLNRWNREISERLRHAPPSVVFVVGLQPVLRSTLRKLKQYGHTTVCFTTDDPFNPIHQTWRFLASLPEYDLVLTPRSATIPDLMLQGCPRVEYFPFGYDERFHYPPPQPQESDGTILYIGGADQDRIELLLPLIQQGCPLALAGGYWQTHRETAPHSLGILPPDQVRERTWSAAVNVILPRHANRDGHVMRTYEAAACGGCLLVQRTEDHERLFGPHGHAVRYFTTSSELKDEVQRIIYNDDLRHQRCRAVTQCVVGEHYTHRLKKLWQMCS